MMTAFVNRMLKKQKKNYNIHIRLSENYQMKIKSDWETHKGIACVQ